MFEVSQVSAILEALRGQFGFVEDVEITLEANPEGLDQQKLEGLRAAGVNRLSLGVQSFDQAVLNVLDRVHSRDKVVASVRQARELGFRVSVDLIYGTPGESLDDWRITVESALALDIDHISAYALIVETGTKLAAQINRGEIAMPDDDAMADMYLLVDSLCEAHGMSWYELSNWSKPGHECKHNVAYWHNANWWGLGPGAHSHMNGKRFWNVKHPSTYKTRVFAGETPIHESEVLTAEQIQVEKIMLSIRMREGISFEELAPHHLERLAIYKENGYVSLHGDSVTLTPVGRLIADRIVRELVM